MALKRFKKWLRPEMALKLLEHAKAPGGLEAAIGNLSQDACCMHAREGSCRNSAAVPGKGPLECPSYT
eukprot:365158-Chlamydomonas_euryale.AAC.6